MALWVLDGSVGGGSVGGWFSGWWECRWVVQRVVGVSVGGGRAQNIRAEGEEGTTREEEMENNIMNS